MLGGKECAKSIVVCSDLESGQDGLIWRGRRLQELGSKDSYRKWCPFNSDKYVCVKNNGPKFICMYLVYLKTFTEHLCCIKLLNGILFTTHI